MILKFDGGYHGHADGLLVQAGSGPLTFGQPDSPGVPAAAAAQTLSVAYNDLAGRATAFEAHIGQTSRSHCRNRSPATWASCRPSQDFSSICGR